MSPRELPCKSGELGAAVNNGCKGARSGAFPEALHHRWLLPSQTQNGNKICHHVLEENLPKRGVTAD